jgi:hypothetical protein
MLDAYSGYQQIFMPNEYKVKNSVDTTYTSTILPYLDDARGATFARIVKIVLENFGETSNPMWMTLWQK